MLKRSKAILKIISIIIIFMILLKLCLVFLWPFLIAVLLVIFMEPLVNLIIRVGLNRKASVVLSFFILILLIIFIAFWLTSYAFNQFLMFFHKLPDIMIIISKRIRFINEKNIDYNQIVNGIEQLIVSYRFKIINTVMSTISSIINIIIIFITTIFISIDLEKIKSLIKKVLSLNFYCIIVNVIRQINNIMKVELQLVLATTLQTIVGLYILGVDSPLTVGLICGILDILPVLGTGLIFFPWIMYELLIENLFTALGLLCMYIVLQISRQVMEVKLMGKSLKIHPVVTILSLYIGFIIYGVWGVILGPFIIILIKELFYKYYEGRSN